MRGCEVETNPVFNSEFRGKGLGHLEGRIPLVFCIFPSCVVLCLGSPFAVLFFCPFAILFIFGLQFHFSFVSGCSSVCCLQVPENLLIGFSVVDGGFKVESSGFWDFLAEGLRA